MSLLFSSDKIKSILIRSTNWIGDVVMVSPSMRAIRMAYPEAKITVLARKHLIAGYEGNPTINHVIPIEGGDFFPLIKNISRERFDLAIIFPKSFESAILPFIARIPIRVGMATDKRSILLTHPVSFIEGDGNLHNMKKFALPLRSIGIVVKDWSPYFPLLENDISSADRLLKENKVVAGKFICIHACASKDSRGWHLERFAEVGKAIYKESGFLTIILGSKSDVISCSMLSGSIPDSINLCGKTKLREMGAIIKESRLLLCNDSGAMHIGAALGAKVVAVFGPGSPKRTGPVAGEDKIKFITEKYPCSPCKQDFFKECKPSPSGKPWCLEDIKVQGVLSACLSLLNK